MAGSILYLFARLLVWGRAAHFDADRRWPRRQPSIVRTRLDRQLEPFARRSVAA